jgi:hypothetical protein
MPSGWLTPFSPPTEESTWDMTVVGTCKRWPTLEKEHTFNIDWLSVIEQVLGASYAAH